MPLVPPFLNLKDKIYILSTAGYIDYFEIEPVVDFIIKQGYEVVIGKTIGTRYFQFSSDSNNRVLDLQTALDSNEIKAILFAKGGYGSIKIIDRVDWTKFRNKPKWLIGFSEVTVYHLIVNHKFKINTLHALMPSTFVSNTKLSKINLIEILSGKFRPISFKNNKNNKNINLPVRGKLSGGNLTVINSLLCLNEINFEDSILLIEDVGLDSFQFDRMLMSLKLSGKIKKIKALLVGDLVNINNINKFPFSKNKENIVLDVFSEYDFPIFFDVPIGHLPNNQSVIMGGEYKITKMENKIELQKTSNYLE